MIAGMAVMTHDAAATTKTPVASAAAGRSQPSRPVRSGSGRNRSTMAPARYRSQMTAGPSHRHSVPSTPPGADMAQPGWTGWRTEILARIRSRPSAAGCYGVARQAQCVPQHDLEAGLPRVRSTMAHDSRSRTERSEAIAREVWLFTAPRVIPMAAAICASDRSP